MNPSRIAIIVEGAWTEPLIINSLKKCFFSGEEETENVSLEIIQLPFCTNIYNFYSLLLNEGLIEDYESSLPVDTIPLLQEKIRKTYQDGNLSRHLPRHTEEDVQQLLSYNRNDFAQLFLFFDIELQDPCGDKDEIIRQLTTIFSNETENGKLYINYPMVESLRDIQTDDECYQNCLLPTSDIPNYKRLVDSRSCFKDANKYNVDTWKLFCKRAVQRASCLLSGDCPPCDDVRRTSLLSFQQYREHGTQDALYVKQYENHISAKSEVMVLSSMPLFLLDYYQESFWRKMVGV